MLYSRRQLLATVLILPLLQATCVGSDSVRIIDDGDAEFVRTGNWSYTQVVIPSVAYNDDYVQGAPAATPGKATWTMFVNPGVRYRVSMIWYTPSVGASAYSTAAPVKVSAGSTVLISKTLNFQSAPNDLTADGLVWENLGEFQVNSNPLTVELSGVTSKTVLADAVRIERMDGRPIFSPTITNVLPKPVLTSGNVQVRILGTDFDQAARFLVNGTEMTNPVFISSTEMRATIPPQSAGLKDVTIISGGGLRHTLREALNYGEILYLDQEDPGFTSFGRWGYTRTTLPNHAYNSDFRQGTPAAAHSFATWSFAVLPDEYLVSIVWPGYSAPHNLAYSNAASFSLWDGDNRLATVRVNQQKFPVGLSDKGLVWQGLGIYRVSSSRLMVRLDSDASAAKKVVLADTVRVQPRRPIRFTSQPEDQSAVIGATVTFSVTVDGARPVAYQWFKNGVRIPNATQETYVTPALLATDTGAKYRCVATNLFGPIPSREATLTVVRGSALPANSLQQ